MLTADAPIWTFVEALRHRKRLQHSKHACVLPPGYSFDAALPELQHWVCCTAHHLATTKLVASRVAAGATTELVTPDYCKSPCHPKMERSLQLVGRNASPVCTCGLCGSQRDSSMLSAGHIKESILHRGKPWALTSSQQLTWVKLNAELHPLVRPGHDAHTC